MTYLVMENHLSYSVVLDEAGRFMQVANRCYKVGQTVENIVPLNAKTSDMPSVRVIGMVSGIAACFVVMLSMYWYSYLSPIGSVYLTVNPDVQMEVSRKDTVVKLNGLNDDGEALIRDYAHRGKSLETVTDDLMDKAIDMGYLSTGDTITIHLDAPDEDWFIREGIALRENLNSYLNGKVTVNIVIQKFDPYESEPQQAAPQNSRPSTESQPPPSSSQRSIQIPLQQPSSDQENTPLPSQNSGNSGYGSDGDSGYGDDNIDYDNDNDYDDDGDSGYLAPPAPAANSSSPAPSVPVPASDDDDYDDDGDSGYDDNADDEYDD